MDTELKLLKYIIIGHPKLLHVNDDISNSFNIEINNKRNNPEIVNYKIRFCENNNVVVSFDFNLVYNTSLTFTFYGILTKERFYIKYGYVYHGNNFVNLILLKCEIKNLLLEIDKLIGDNKFNMNPNQYKEVAFVNNELRKKLNTVNI